MDYAYVAVAAAPMRRKARHQAEMVNQLVFGEPVKILKRKGSLWLKVRCLYDTYEGWLTSTMLTEAEEYEVKQFCPLIAGDLVNTISVNGANVLVPFGSFLPGLNQGAGLVGQIEYTFNGRSINRAEVKPDAEFVAGLAKMFLQTPYLWGGRTVFGIDCSGFIQQVFKAAGIDLPRDAWQQAQEGKIVEKIRDAQPGDLVFFDDREEIVHVGMLLSNSQIIHASGQVRIDLIDKKGIVHSETGKRTHSLRAIKRNW